MQRFLLSILLIVGLIVLVGLLILAFRPGQTDRVLKLVTEDVRVGDSEKTLREFTEEHGFHLSIIDHTKPQIGELERVLADNKIKQGDIGKIFYLIVNSRKETLYSERVDFYFVFDREDHIILIPHWIRRSSL